jgi:hypothetical protein
MGLREEVLYYDRTVSESCPLLYYRFEYSDSASSVLVTYVKLI